MSWTDSAKKTFMAGEDLAAYRRVKLDSSSTTDPPEMIYADAGEDFDGVTEYAADEGQAVMVRLKNAEGTFEVEASTTCSLGASLYGAADGKLSTTENGSVQAKALEASGAASDVIEVLLS